MLNKELTILEILPFVNWKTVKKAIKFYYPFDKNDYEHVFELLKTFRKRKQKDKDERIEVYVTNDALIFPDDEDCRGEYYGIATNKYSLSFRKWKEVANILVSKETIESQRLSDIVAHFIWEITYFGTEKQTEKQGKKLIESVKKIKKDY